MTLAPTTEIMIAAGHRLQFEAAQDRFVLLYPEGMVELGDGAAAILSRLASGARRFDALLADLHAEFEGDDIDADVRSFVEDAHERGWLRLA